MISAEALISSKTAAAGGRGSFFLEEAVEKNYI
jgi:hypothetical protein